MDTLGRYLKSIEPLGRITRAKERSLSRIITSRSASPEAIMRARDEMMKANLRLVVKIAVRMSQTFHLRSITVMDMISEGNMALAKAAMRYKGRHKSRASFGTFATKVIDGKIRRLLALDRLGEAILLDDLARRDDGESSWAETIEDVNAPMPTKMNYTTSLGEYLHKHISKLSEREQKIIKEKFLSDQEPTLDDISKGAGVTRERVRQILHTTLRKLKGWIVKDWNGKQEQNNKCLPPKTQSRPWLSKFRAITDPYIEGESYENRDKRIRRQYRKIVQEF